MKKPFYKSKKFISTLLGVIGVIGVNYFDVPMESVETITELIMAYVVGQGIADSGIGRV